MKKLFVFPAAVIGAAMVVLVVPAQAENSPQDNTVIVTATRTAQTADDALASVTVITRDDIERRQAHSADELLRGEPGIMTTNNGGRGKASSFFLRGTESDHVLVLVDGIKIGSATLGTASLQDIPADQIERIEIVRGPRSSLYGSEAIGGVIQIFTRKGNAGPLQPYFKVGAGSLHSYESAFGVSGGGEHASFNATLSADGTRGFNSCQANFSGGCFDDEPDRDGYRNQSGSVRWGYRFDNGTDVDLHWLRTYGDSEFDGYFNSSDSTQQMLGAKIQFARVGNWQGTLTAGNNRDTNENDGDAQASYETRRRLVGFQNDLSFGAAQLLSIGIDTEHDTVDSTTTYTVGSRDNDGVYAQYQARLGAHDFQTSLRRDDNEQFGKHTTGGIAWGVDLDGGPRLTISYGTAFKAPTFNELYFPGFGTPTLKPEESKTGEVGVSGKFDGGRWSLNAYETRVDEMIGFDASFISINIDSSVIRGVEAVTSWRAGDWTFNANLNALDPRNRSDDANNGNLLPRRARYTMRLMADTDVGACRTGVTLTGEGDRFDDLENDRPLDGYTLVDLRGEYAFDKTWSLLGRVENLFDKVYQTAEFYNQPRRGVFVTLRYQPSNQP